jgi:UDP-N-acetylmuramoylalanine--D-glutamate ligase
MLSAHGEVIGVDAGHPEVDLDCEVHLGESGIDLLERAGTVVKSPGVPAGAPVIATARERGLPVLGELELAWRLLPNPFVAVTGTNGKTTTVELLGAIWRAAGLPVAVAGNVGTPVAGLVGELDAAATVICECSSFQLEDSEAFAPECAVLLNVEPDHLDRHGTLGEYRAAKLRIFANQQPGDTAILPAALEPERPGAAVAVFIGEQPDPGPLGLRGAHNAGNARAAAAAARALGVPGAAIATALREFRGVPHRLEEVAEVDGVLYVNDSKATNVAAAAGGIEAFEGGVHVILGGSLKGGGFEGLRAAVADRCRGAYLIGAASDRLAADLAGAVPLHPCGTLERAVDAAAEDARPGDVVLLSPACASFDQFRDYEDRGRRFRELVPRPE